MGETRVTFTVTEAEAEALFLALHLARIGANKSTKRTITDLIVTLHTAKETGI